MQFFPLNSRTGTRESGLEFASWIPVRPFHRGLPAHQDAQGPGARLGARPRGPTPDAPPREAGRLASGRRRRPYATLVPPCVPVPPAPLTAYSPDPRPGHSTE